MSARSTKQRLLDAAIKSINERGESGLRIDDLLEEVDVKAPTLYHHFGSREGLMVEAQAERFLTSIRTGVPEVIAAFERSNSVEDLRGAVRLAISMRGDASRIRYRLQRLNALGAAYARPELARRIVEAHEQVVREVAAAMVPFQRRGLIRADINLEMVVALYNGALIGGLLVELDGATLDPREWETVMMDALDHLLFGV